MGHIHPVVILDLYNVGLHKVFLFLHFQLNNLYIHTCTYTYIEFVDIIIYNDIVGCFDRFFLMFIFF